MTVYSLLTALVRSLCPHTISLSPPSPTAILPPCNPSSCEPCVDKLFTLGAETCLADGCNRVIRKTNLNHQTFNSLELEKELAIRKRIAGM